MQGFLNEEAVRIAADVYATSSRAHEGQQRIIPGIRFTCTGTLTKWIIGAQRTLTQTANHPQLQIWRRRQVFYRKTDFSVIAALNATSDLNVYEYIPNPPLEFQTNDVLGLYQPPISNTQTVVHYQWEGGPQNFVVLRSLLLRGIDNDLPLVAVEVNGNLIIITRKSLMYVDMFIYCFVGGSARNCTEGFITRERLTDIAYFIQNFVYMYGRQLIIQNMTFTRSGSLVRWTFAAQYNASATQYPELQVWRENTTGTYVKRESTDNMEPVQTPYLNVYEHVLNPPLQVLPGDVLGIYQPSSRNSRLHLLFLLESNYVNWYAEASRPWNSFMTTDSQTNNVLPLVAVSFEPVRSSNGPLVPTMLPNPRATPPSVTYTAALSLLPTPGSDDFFMNDSPAGAIAGALVGVMVVVVAAVAVVVLVVLALRRRQRKSLCEPDIQGRTVDNPIYAGSVSDVHGVWLL